MNSQISDLFSKSLQNKRLILILLALICTIEFVSHLNIDGELIAWGPYSANWGSSSTPKLMLNGKGVHFEGISNLMNTYFFSGAESSYFTLGYTIPTGRLFAPFLAGLLNPFTGNILYSIYLINLLFWIAASWAAYGLGKLEFDSELAGIVVAILVATGQGFISRLFGTKTHVTSYAYYIIMIYMCCRLRIFEKGTPTFNYFTMGVIAALGIVLNGTHLLFVIFLGVMWVFHPKTYKIIITIAVPVAVSLIIEAFLYDFVLPSYIHIGNVQEVMIRNFIIHLKAILHYLSTGEHVPFVLDSTSGANHHTNVWGPWYWIRYYSPRFIMMCGIPLLVLAIVGLFRMKIKNIQLVLASLLGGYIGIYVTLTYWPFPLFFGYLSYYSAIAFFILAANGILNIGLLSKSIASRFISKSISTMVYFTTVTAMVVYLIGFTNQDVLFGRYIEHQRHGAHYFVNFPSDWDFRVLNW